MIDDLHHDDVSQADAAPEPTGLEVAVIGMAGRFPGADDLSALWRDLRAGREAITSFSREQLEAAGAPAAELDDPNFVPRRAFLEGAEQFDAAFFDVNPREAEILDPQQRLFLETVWHALEDAACDPSTTDDRIGLFGGVSMSTYLLQNLLPNRELLARVGSFQAMLANDKDYLTTRVSYKLGLKGPSVLVQTACSTSLVATHLACQSLINGECEVALAGGVSVTFPQHRGYVYQEGAILSPDGHCRPFDHKAQGTVNGDGVGVVVLKRLEDALADGDRIRAVIRGSAINNDGSDKVGFTAPSVAGQTTVIGNAQVMAEVEADTLGYVEGHGTATPIGDPIELEALDEAFRVTTDRKGFCALGSIKGNLGHLDAAAGVAALSKTVLALEHAEIPPTVHFEAPQPESVLADSAFVVSSELRPWPVGETPRRAAVSSFGLGGTNAHVVLEEAPASDADPEVADEAHLLVLSARTPSALEAARQRLADHLEANSQDALADVAYTTQRGRRAFEHRHAVVCRDRSEAVATLRGERPKALLGGFHDAGDRPVVFLFPGQGTQFPGMARTLYGTAPVFREELDRCLDVLRPLIAESLASHGFAGDPLDLLAAAEADDEQRAETLRHTAHAQPLLFAVEYALARQLEAWGVTPSAMLGHSLGEWVAACLAGVWSLDDALHLVAARGRLMAATHEASGPGAMITIPLSADEVRAEIERRDEGGTIELAAINAPDLVVATGPEEAVMALGRELGRRDVECRRLHTSHAFHSVVMEPALEPFRAELERRPPKAPEGRFVSNVSGDWIAPEEAADPDYWLRQLRQPVRFADGLARLLAEPDAVLLEVGPGRSLASLARRQPGWTAGRAMIGTLPGGGDSPSEHGAPGLEALGRLWLAGVRPDWRALHGDAARRKVALPGYVFDHQTFWIAPPAEVAGVPTGTGASSELTPGTSTESAAASAGQARPAGLSTVFEAPQGELESRLVGLWSELLGVEGIGRHDDFFELGGHSLMGTQLLSRVREVLGAEVPLRQLLEGPTVADLSAAIEATGASGEGAIEPPPLDPIPRDGGLPLSFSQERLWIVDQMTPGSPAYNISFALRLRGELDVALLEACFAALERRHESLRTIFGQNDDRPVQIVEEPGRLHLRVADLRGLDVRRREKEMHRLVVHDALRPFEITVGPLFRVALVRLTDTDAAMLVSFHHIISDGWSFGIIAGELSALYNGHRSGDLPTLPPLPVHYVDYAAWQRDWLQGEVLDRQVAYWQDKLAMPPEELVLPTRRSTSATDFRGAVHTLEWTPAVAEALVRVGRERKATLYMVVLAAWKSLLHTFGGQEDVVVGSPIAGRVHRRTEPLVGFFVNTLVLRTDLSGDPTFEEILERVRETTHGAYAHQDLPFERLVSALRLDRDLHRMPLFRVWFVLQNTPAHQLALGEAEAEPIRPESLAVRHDLKLDLTEDEDGLHGFFEYKTGLFDAAGVEQIAFLLGRVFEEITQEPTLRLSMLRERLDAAAQSRRAKNQRKLKSAALRRLQRGRRSSEVATGKDSES